MSSPAGEPGHVRHHGGVEAFKASLFQLVHSLAERGAHHRTTTSSQVVALATFLFDWLQLLSLLVRPQWGFHEDLVSLANTINVRHQMFGGDWVRVQWTCLAVSFGVVGFFAFFNHVRRRVASSSRDGNSRELSFLRMGCSLLCSPCYTMVVDVVTAPLSCNELRTSLGDDWECFGGAHVAICVACVVAIAVFVPHAVLLKQIFHESDPNAAEILAQSTGTGDALLACTTMLAATLALAAYRLPALSSLLAVLPLIFLTGWTAMHLPFYHQLLNPAACLLHASAVHLMIGALISSTSSGSDSVFSIIWVATMPVSIGIGVWLPLFQWARISRILAAIRPKMLQELRDRHRSHEGYNSPAHELRANIEELAARATETRFRVARLPLSETDDVEMPAPAEVGSSSTLGNLSSFEAELLVRCELSQPGNTDSRKRRRRFGRSTGSVPTTKAVEHSMWLYAEAMNEFAEDAVGIARVKIEYARFLQVYTGDVNLATGALEGALRERPSFEGEYQVFSRTHRLQIKRQSQVTDADASMNQVAMVDYARRLRGALHHHASALAELQKLLGDIHRHKATLVERADTMADKLGARIAGMATHAAEAHKQYRKLMVTHTGAPGLDSVYRRFRRDVLHEQSLDDASDTGSVASGASSKTHSWTKSNTGLVPISASEEVIKIDHRFRVGSLILVLLGIGMAISTAMFVSQSDSDIEALRVAGDLRRHVVDAALAVRHGAMIAGNSSEVSSLRNDTYAEMVQFKQDLLFVYQRTSTDDVVNIWEQHNRRTTAYSSNNTWSSRTFNLWRLVNVLVADTVHFLEHPHGYHDNKHWRFVMDNAGPTVLPALQEAIDALQWSAEERARLFDIVQGCLLGLLVLVSAYLGFGVFGRALTRVRDIKVGVVDIAANIPPLTVSRMRRQVARGLAFVRRAGKQADEATVTGGENEEASRGLGPVGNFTYDADLDRGNDLTLGSCREGKHFPTLPTLKEERPAGPLPALSLDAPVEVEEHKGTPHGHSKGTHVSSPTPHHPMGHGPSSASRCPVAAHTIVSSHGLRHRETPTTPSNVFADVAAVPKPTAMLRGIPPIDAILKHVPGGIICTDAIGTVLYSNKKAQAILGYTEQELLGGNVTMLQPEALAARHHDIMSRVTNGGEPEVIGKAGRQLRAIMKDKQERPVLLALGRLDIDGRTFYIADMADISDEVEQEEGQQEERVDQHKLVWAFIRVLLALLFVLLLQLGNVVFGMSALATITGHAAQVSRASQLRSLSQYMVFSCREAAIGDGEIWTATESTKELSSALSLFSTIRFGLRFGDPALGLPGSVGVDEKQDRLQFGDVQVEGEVFQGLDATMALYERRADSCVRAFAHGSASVGPNASALSELPTWTAMEVTSREPLRGMLEESEQLYLDLTHYQAEQVLLVDQVVTTFNCVVVVILYFAVFRKMVGDLLEQARWTEHMLGVVPPELGMSGPLRKYFRRRTAKDTND